jgi:hypothetical protein
MIHTENEEDRKTLDISFIDTETMSHDMMSRDCNSK